jgi:hypothetical protein
MGQNGSNKVHRSPRYPGIGLRQATRLLKNFFDAIGLAETSPQTAARALGFASPSGLARSRLGSLKMYGLLEKVGNGVRIARLGEQLLSSPADSPEFTAALRTAASLPPLFEEVHEAGVDMTDDSLANYLRERHNFTETGVKGFVAAYRETQGSVERPRLTRQFEPIELGRSSLIREGAPTSLARFSSSLPVEGVDVHVDIWPSSGVLTGRQLEEVGRFLEALRARLL